MKYWRQMLLSAPALAICPVAELPAIAETEAAPRAAGAAIPAKIPSDVFVDPGYIFRPLISPDGQKIAFRERLAKKIYLSIRPVDGTRLTRLALPEKHSVNWYRWASDNKLLISVTGIGQIYGIEVPVNVLMAHDLSTGQTIKLGRKSQGLQGDDVLYVDPSGEYVLLALARSIFEHPGVYHVGIADNALTEIVRPQSGIGRWLADDNGIVRMGFAYSRLNTKIFYRRSNDEKFALISKIREKDNDDARAESLIDVSHIVSGEDEGYVLSNKETGRFALYRFNYLTREIGEKILAHDENDITSFRLNDEGTAIESAFHTDERDRITWFDPVYKKHQKALDKALPGQEAWIQSRSRDGKKMTVFSTSPTNPGSYYIFEPAAGRLHRFAGINDRISPSRLAVTKYVRYTARDGLSIPAYLTLPVGRTAKGLPLIIMPHGGPYGVRDTLDYNSEVQFLANRGYAVIQPNFRGSESYGEDFYERGEGQIGRAMQDDLDDAMDWLVKDGIADPARVCVVGSSYGGYAALWGVIRNPERYRCAASFAGVTDFKSQLKYSLKTLKTRYRREWQTTVQGGDEFNLDTVSPAKNAARLNRPVLLTHGDQDSTVPFSQHKTMMAALKKAGKTVESHVYEGEGHGFDDNANEKDWLDRLEAFLAKHNPAETPPD